jgi:hypothetical protein
MLCITRLENVLQVLALVGLGWRLCPTNRACTCKMAFSSLVIQNIKTSKENFAKIRNRVTSAGGQLECLIVL